MLVHHADVLFHTTAPWPGFGVCHDHSAMTESALAVVHEINMDHLGLGRLMSGYCMLTCLNSFDAANQYTSVKGTLGVCNEYVCPDVKDRLFCLLHEHCTVASFDSIDVFRFLYLVC